MNNPEDVLKEEILADARRQAEKLLKKAQAEVASLERASEESLATFREKVRTEAHEAGVRRRDLALARVAIEVARSRVARVDAVLDSVKKMAQEGIASAKVGADLLISLTREAIFAVGCDVTVAFSAGDWSILEGSGDWRSKVLDGVDFSVSFVTREMKDSSSGPFVSSLDGSKFFDGHLSAKLRRMWPLLRAKCGDLLGLTDCVSSGNVVNEGEREEVSGPVVEKVSGPIVTARGMDMAQMYEVVRVGDDGLIGEVVRINNGHATIQVYEDTTLLKPGAPVKLTGAPLSVCLGPGLIGNIYDGIQRPLPALEAHFGAFIGRGGDFDAVDMGKKWDFEACDGIKVGDVVCGGDILGYVQETPLFRHTIMVPPDVEGKVVSFVGSGSFSLSEPIASVETELGVRELFLMQKWPVRVPRPTRRRLRITEPLVTGQRIIDTLFPIGKGGTAAIPGGFGTGKTCTQHQLAKWSDADIIVYVGCGERGNEMTDVLREFPEIIDPKSGHPLMERTILIANTSNMPVAAREVSIYTGITLAEYYRDMGHSVALFADSTSRWAEALRELAARLEEMPAEEGFPATLPTRLAQFYERAGSFETLSGGRGAISIVGAVSPPGGDFSEPVTQHTQRFIRCFWALDSELANARHYPSINWLRSYSEYGEDVAKWWCERATDWYDLRQETMQIMQREDRLQQIVKLVGPDVLPDQQRLVLFVAEMVKDGFLTQSAFDDVDMYCSPERQMAILRLIISVYRRGEKLIESGVPLLKIQRLPAVTEVMRAKAMYSNEMLDRLADLESRLSSELDSLGRGFKDDGGVR